MNVNLRFVNLLKSTVIIGTIVITLLISSVSNVFAGGPRSDAPEDAIGDSDACHVNGYDSGFAGKYDSERAKDCLENGGDAYNFAWAVGCEDSTRTEKECGELINNPVELEEEDYDKLKDENASICYDAGQEDGEAGKPFNEEIEDGCYEFGGYNRGYTAGYQLGCERHTTESSCELRYEEKSNYCPNHPDVVGCVDFLHNATNKVKENPDSVCSGMGDPRPNIVCFQEQNPEKYCLGHDNPTFCRTIGDLCDADGFVKPEYPYCTSR